MLHIRIFYMSCTIQACLGQGDYRFPYVVIFYMVGEIICRIKAAHGSCYVCVVKREESRKRLLTLEQCFAVKSIRTII